MADTYHRSVVMAYVDVAGTTYDVQEFKLTLAAGGVPQLTLQIDPTPDSIGQSVAPERIIASVENITTERDELEEYSRGDDRTVEFAATVAFGDFGDLLLQDWLLVGVGGIFDRNGTAIGISLDIRHPAWALVESAPQLDSSGVYKPANLSVFSAAGNLLELIRLCVQENGPEAEHNKKNVNTLAANDLSHLAVRGESARTAYANLITALNESLEWKEIPSTANSSGFPFHKLEDLKPALIYAMFSYMQRTTAAGAWDQLLLNGLGEWSAALVPTYWKPTLTITPFGPWEVPVGKIPITNFSRIERPASTPITTNAMLLRIPGLSEMSFRATAEGQKANLYEGQAQVLKDVQGRTVPLAIPSWLRYALQTQGAVNAGKTNPASKIVDQSLLIPGADEDQLSNVDNHREVTDADSDIAVYQKGLKEAVASELLLEYYLRQTSITLVGRYMPRHAGITDAGLNNYLVPGTVLQITGDDDQDPKPEEPGTGKGLYDFYVTKVVHVISRTRNSASTHIAGQYVRSSEAVNITTVDAPTTFIRNGVGKNKMYGDG